AFLKTDDGGQTWTDLDSPRISYVYCRFFISPIVGWIAGTVDGRSVVYRTINGGSTWAGSRSVIPSGHIGDLWFYDSDRGWMIVESGAHAGAAPSAYLAWPRRFRNSCRFRLD